MAAYKKQDKEDPWQWSTPERSTLELPLRGASSNVRSVSEVGAIPTPVNPCGDSSGCFIGMSVSSYSSKFMLSKILTSSTCRSSSMIGVLRFVALNANEQILVYFIVCYSELRIFSSYGHCPVPDCPCKRDMSVLHVAIL